MTNEAPISSLRRSVELICLLLVGASVGSAWLQRSPEAASGELPTMAATVRSVDTKQGTLDVITGVGLALRVIRFRVDKHCQIKVRGEAAKLTDLRPGEVVRLQYRKIDDRRMVQTIETLQFQSARGKP